MVRGVNRSPYARDGGSSSNNDSGKSEVSVVTIPAENIGGVNSVDYIDKKTGNLVAGNTTYTDASGRVTRVVSGGGSLNNSNNSNANDTKDKQGFTSNNPETNTNPNFPVRRTLGRTEAITGRTINSGQQLPGTPRQSNSFNIKDYQQKTQAPQRDNVTTFIESEKAKDKLTTKRTSEQFISDIGAGKSKINPVVDDYFSMQESKLKTIRAPSLEQIRAKGDNRNALKTIFYIGEEPQLKASDVTYATDKALQQQIQQQEQRDFDRAINAKYKDEFANINPEKYQARIEAGEDYDIVNSEYMMDVEGANTRLKDFASGFDSQWQVEKGDYLQKNREKIVFSTREIYGSKDIQAEAGSYFNKGFVSGGLITGGAFGGSAISSALGLGKGVTLGTAGAVLGIGYASYAITKSKITGYQKYSEARELGFSRRESLKYGILGGANDIAPDAFGAAGGVAGGLAVYGGLRAGTNLARTGSIKGWTKQDTEIAKNLFNRKDSTTSKNIWGELTESQTKRLAIKELGPEYLGEIKSASSVQKLRVKFNEEGLTARESKTVKKLNYRADTYQLTSQVGTTAYGKEITKIRTGKLLDIYPKGYGLGVFKGSINLETGKFTGQRVSALKQGDILKNTYEKFYSFGKVKYADSPRYKDFYRLELSKGRSVSLYESFYKKGIFQSSTPRARVTSSKNIRYSELKEYGYQKFNRGNKIFDIKFFRTYKDINGMGLSGKTQFETVFKIKKYPKTKSNFGIGNQNTVLKTLSKPVDFPTTLPTSNALKSLTLNNVVTPKGYGNSIYAGSSYGLVSGQSNGPLNIRNALSDFARGFASQNSKATQAFTGSAILESSPEGKRLTRGGTRFDSYLKEFSVGGLNRRQNLISGISERPEQKRRSNYYSGSNLGLGLDQLPGQKLNQPQLQIPKQRQNQKSLVPNSPFNFRSFEFGSFRPMPPIAPLPGLKLFDYERKGRGRKGPRAKSRYAPNIAAIGFNITAPKIPKSYTKGFGSLTLRPVIANPFKTKRRKNGRRKTRR